MKFKDDRNSWIITTTDGVIHVIDMEKIDRVWMYFDNLDLPSEDDELTKVVMMSSGNKEYYNIAGGATRSHVHRCMLSSEEDC